MVLYMMKLQLAALLYLVWGHRDVALPPPTGFLFKRNPKGFCTWHVRESRPLEVTCHPDF